MQVLDDFGRVDAPIHGLLAEEKLFSMAGCLCLDVKLKKEQFLLIYVDGKLKKIKKTI